MRSLQALGVPSDAFSYMLKVIVRQRIPASLDTQWLLSQSDIDAVSANDMLSYLEKKVRVREQANFLTHTNSDLNHSSAVKPPSRNFMDGMTVTTVSRSKCFLCEDASHSLWNCTFTYKQKTAVVKRKAACFNCFKSDHQVCRCTSKGRCKKCGRKHHTSIHPPEGSEDQGSPSE